MLNNFKNYVSRDDVSKYVLLSNLVKEQRLNTVIQETMLADMRSLLGTNFYVSLMNLYSEVRLVSSITPDVQTIIQLTDVSEIDTGARLRVTGMQGGVSALNGRLVEVLGVSGNEITVDLNSFGLTYTGGGEAGEISPALLWQLRQYLEPLVSYGVYGRLIPRGNLVMTEYGSRIKENQYSQVANPEIIGQEQEYTARSQNTWKELAKEFMNDNETGLKAYGFEGFDKRIVYDTQMIPIYSKPRSLLKVFRRDWWIRNRRTNF